MAAGGTALATGHGVGHNHYSNILVIGIKSLSEPGLQRTVPDRRQTQGGLQGLKHPIQRGDGWGGGCGGEINGHLYLYTGAGAL